MRIDSLNTQLTTAAPNHINNDKKSLDQYFSEFDSLMVERHFDNAKLIHIIDEFRTSPFGINTSRIEKFELSDLDTNVPKNIKISDFSEENIEKIYPADKYNISRKNKDRIEYITVKDKSNNRPVIDAIILYKQNEKDIYRIEITDFNQKGEELTVSSYNGLGNLQYSDLSSKIYSKYANLINQEICEKKTYCDTSANNIEKLIKEITPENVAGVINAYQTIDDESLISAIFGKKELSAQKRYELSKHLVDAVVKNAKKNSEESINKVYCELKHQRDRWLPMNSENIDKYLTIIMQGYSKNVMELNGKLDEDFSQGNTGDCWLLAGIKSIMNNPQAKEILEKNIKVLKNGDIEITLMINNKTYRITKEEIDDYKDYSYGDPDIKAIEIAVKKYKGIRGITGGSPSEAFQILLGHGNFCENTDASIIDKIKSKKYLVVLGSGNSVTKIFNKYEDKTALDKHNETVNLNTHHAYSILNADDNYIYISDPHRSQETLKMTIPDFMEMNGSIGYLKLDDIGKKQFISDENLYIIKNCLIGIGITTAIKYGKPILNTVKNLFRII